jgi:hypothetical protein
VRSLVVLLAVIAMVVIILSVAALGANSNVEQTCPVGTVDANPCK